MKENLIGKHFEHLTVIGYNEETKKWICKCDCGKVTEVLGYNLRLGNTKSCGHLKNGVGIKRTRKVNIMGEQIGQLLVTDVNDIKKIATVKCLQCKRVSKMPTDVLIELKKSRKKSIVCGLDGCEYKNIKRKASGIKKGTRFGRLVVLERLENKIVKTKKSETSIPMYLCKCDCGKQVEVQGRYLLDGRTKSCGCLRSKNFLEKNSHNNLALSKTGKKAYEIYIKWQQKYRQPTKLFKKKIIDKNIKFFPELKNSEEPFKNFLDWARLNGFSIKDNRIYLDRKDYDKDFSMSNCFWSQIKTRGY